MPDSESPAPSLADEHRSRGRPFRLNAIWIGVALIAILSLAQLIGILIHNLNQTRMGAIFAIGVVAFLGMLSLGHQGRRYHPFEPGEVRMALTTSFAMVFFSAVAIFLFSTNTVGTFGTNLMNNLTSLFGIVIGFYFASSAALEYGKLRVGKDAAPASGEGPAPRTISGDAPALPTTSALEAKVAELEATVARLTAAADGHDQKTSAPTEPAVTLPAD